MHKIPYQNVSIFLFVSTLKYYQYRHLKKKYLSNFVFYCLVKMTFTLEIVSSTMLPCSALSFVFAADVVNFVFKSEFVFNRIKNIRSINLKLSFYFRTKLLF